MARKHDNFTYSHGWRTAPEQWYFGWNGKTIDMDYSTRTHIAQLMIAGKEDEAIAILKRLLRKQEKEDSYICIGFWTEDRKDYYFTSDLMCRADSLQDKLRVYKEWKRYIMEHNGVLSTHTVTTGYVSPCGMTAGVEEEIEDRIDLTRPCTVRVLRPKMFQCFQ